MKQKKSLIIDLDGVCFDPTKRLERCSIEIQGIKSINWDKFFSNEEVEQDPVIKNAVLATQKISRKYQIIYLTGRSKKCEHATLFALFSNQFGSDNSSILFMREVGDKRPDHEMKQEKIRSFQKGRQIFAAIDDDYSGKLRSMYLENDIDHFYNFEDFFESDHWEGD